MTRFSSMTCYLSTKKPDDFMSTYIAFWEAPRSRATALAYSFYNGLRDQGFNCLWQDEPLHWRRLDGRDKNVIHDHVRSQAGVHAKATDFVIQPRQAKWVYDPRNLAYVQKLDWVRNLKNVVVIRDLSEMILSHDAGLKYAREKEGVANTPHLDAHVLGIEQLAWLVRSFDDQGIELLVIDSNEVTRSPDDGVKFICQHLDLPYSESMVHWGQTPEIEAPPWGESWYRSLMSSRRLRKYESKDSKLSPQQKAIYDQVLPAYEYITSRKSKI